MSNTCRNYYRHLNVNNCASVDTHVSFPSEFAAADCPGFYTTQFKTDISAFVIAGDNAEEILLASEIQSGTLSRRYILSIDAGEDKLVSPAFTNELLQKLQAISGVVDVWATDENKAALGALSSLYAQHGAQLYSLYPEQALTAILTEPALAERAAGLRQALLSPQAGLIKT